jgi:hypothetical protein
VPAANRHGHTPGLRREELATLAGVSVDYYARLERGKETRPVGRGVVGTAQLSCGGAHLVGGGPAQCGAPERPGRGPDGKRRRAARQRPRGTHVLREH